MTFTFFFLLSYTLNPFNIPNTVVEEIKLNFILYIFAFIQTFFLNFRLILFITYEVLVKSAIARQYAICDV